MDDDRPTLAEVLNAAYEADAVPNRVWPIVLDNQATFDVYESLLKSDRWE